MRPAVLSTFLFVAILGLACMGVAVPGKAAAFCITGDGKYLYDYGTWSLCKGGSSVNKAEFLLGLSKLSRQQVCRWAVIEKTAGGSEWDGSAQYSYYVKEAKRRSLTLTSCGNQLTKQFTGPKTDADYRMGLHAYNRGDYSTALLEFIPLAKKGHPDAQSHLGMMYADGQGVAKNYKMAMKWYKLAAEQGNGSAQFWLARHPVTSSETHEKEIKYCP